MTRKKTRRDIRSRGEISIRGETHRRVKEEARKQNKSMSVLIEEWIRKDLDAKHVPHPSASH